MSISGEGAKLKSYRTVKVIEGRSEVIDVPRNCFVAAVRVPDCVNGHMTVLGAFSGEPGPVFAEGESLESMVALPNAVIVLYPEVMKPLKCVRFDFVNRSEHEMSMNGEMEVCLLVV